MVGFIELIFDKLSAVFSCDEGPALSDDVGEIILVATSLMVDLSVVVFVTAILSPLL